MRSNRLFAAVAASLLIAVGAAAQSFEQVPQAPSPQQQAPAMAAAKGGIAIVNVQAALASTQEGQQAAQQLQERFRPVSTQIETLRQEITDLQRRLQEGQRTLSQAAQLELQVEIETKAKQGRRLEEDFQEDSQRAQNDLLGQLGEKMRPIIDQYAQQNNISLIFSVNPQNPPIYVAPGVNITAALVRLYDQAHPVAGAGQGNTGN